LLTNRVRVVAGLTQNGRRLLWQVLVGLETHYAICGNGT
jgi:hypothetical protein